MTRFRLTPEAARDLDDIKSFLLGQGGAPLAWRVLTEIRGALNFLASTPEAGHKREDLTSEPMKFWSVFFIHDVYDPAAKPISVARVLHGSRDLEAVFRSQPPRA